MSIQMRPGWVLRDNAPLRRMSVRHFIPGRCRSVFCFVLNPSGSGGGRKRRSASAKGSPRMRSSFYAILSWLSREKKMRSWPVPSAGESDNVHNSGWLTGWTALRISAFPLLRPVQGGADGPRPRCGPCGSSLQKTPPPRSKRRVYSHRRPVFPVHIF